MCVELEEVLKRIGKNIGILRVSYRIKQKI